MSSNLYGPLYFTFLYYWSNYVCFDNKLGRFSCPFSSPNLSSLSFSLVRCSKQFSGRFKGMGIPRATAALHHARSFIFPETSSSFRPLLRVHLFVHEPNNLFQNSDIYKNLSPVFERKNGKKIERVTAQAHLSHFLSDAFPFLILPFYRLSWGW